MARGVGIARQGTRFDLFRDGQVVATGNSAAAIVTDTKWMIGRQRNAAGDYDGSIADVKVYNYSILDKSDLDGDGNVDLSDFNVFSQNWLMTNCGACSGADMNFDEDVDITDFALFSRVWMN